MEDLIRTSIGFLPVEEAIAAYLDSGHPVRVKWPREVKYQLTGVPMLDRQPLMDWMSSKVSGSGTSMALTRRPDASSMQMTYNDHARRDRQNEHVTAEISNELAVTTMEKSVADYGAMNDTANKHGEVVDTQHQSVMDLLHQQMEARRAASRAEAARRDEKHAEKLGEANDRRQQRMKAELAEAERRNRVGLEAEGKREAARLIREKHSHDKALKEELYQQRLRAIHENKMNTQMEVNNNLTKDVNTSRLILQNAENEARVWNYSQLTQGFGGLQIAGHNAVNHDMLARLGLSHLAPSQPPPSMPVYHPAPQLTAPPTPPPPPSMPVYRPVPQLTAPPPPPPPPPAQLSLESPPLPIIQYGSISQSVPAQPVMSASTPAASAKGTFTNPAFMMPPPPPAILQGSGAASNAPADLMTDEDFAAGLRALGTSEEDIKASLDKLHAAEE